MKNVKLIYLSVLTSLFPFTFTFAQQVDQVVAKNYSQDVVVKVYSVTSKIKLDQDKQIRLADYFKTQNGVVATAIMNGKSQKQIDSIQNQANNGLKNILKPEEYIKYSLSANTQNQNPSNLLSNTKIALAINNIASLGLSIKQVDSLNEALLKMDNINGQDETLLIKKILTQPQYDAFLIIKNKPTATKWATGDWANIKAHGLDKGLDSATVVEQIINYDSNRLAVKDKYKDDPAQLDTNVKNIDLSMPSILKQLKATLKNNNPSGKNASTVSTGYVW